MYFCTLIQLICIMKKKTNLLTMAALSVLMALVGCKKNSVLVSSQDVWFGLEAGTKTIEVTANCEWTVELKDDADWYTVTPTSGENDGTITVTVEALEDADYRGTMFVITSPGGHIRRTVFVSQNKLDFDGMVNKVFGVMELEHWNTDFFGQIIEDSYRHKIYDPYDTSTGYLMYFLENGKGVQRDHHNDTAVYYAFDYEYDPVNQILHIDFETITGAPESYSPNVLTASDSLYRFRHEYKSNWWERADMRKVGVFNPDRDDHIRRAATKRKKENEGIFKID